MREGQTDIINCDNCKRTFSYTNHGDRWAGGKENEPIVCPYCRENNGWVMTSGVILSSKIE
jgi:uncharacterized protein CbrC (UPF0167 family)